MYIPVRVKLFSGSHLKFKIEVIISKYDIYG